MGKEYVQQDLFGKKGKVKRVGTRFEIELEDGTLLEINEEDAKKIRDELNKHFAYPDWYYKYPQPYIQPINPYVYPEPPYKIGDFPPYGSGTATLSWNNADGSVSSRQIEYPASSGNHVYAGESRDYPFESN